MGASSWQRDVREPRGPADLSGRAASQIVMTEYFRRRHEQLMHYIDELCRRLERMGRGGLLLSTATARLTEAQAAALGEKIQALIDGAVEQYRDQQGEGVRPVTLRADIFPLPTEGEAS